MTTTTIRQKLTNYIRVADDEKLKAIYTILENEIEEETAWWKNAELMKDMNKEYKSWEDGEEKAYTLAEAGAAIEQVKLKRNKGK